MNIKATTRTKQEDEENYGSPSSSITKNANSSRRTRRACDRCRLKKAKCDGKSPCSTCVSYKRNCIFSARRRREVRSWLCEMQDVLDEAIQVLYGACKRSNSFPGILPPDDGGLVSTEEILRGLGLIKMNLETPPVGRNTQITVEIPQNTYQSDINMRSNLEHPLSDTSLPFFLAQHPTFEVVYEIDPRLSDVPSSTIDLAAPYDPYIETRNVMHELTQTQLHRRRISSVSSSSRRTIHQTTKSTNLPVFTEATMQMQDSTQPYAMFSSNQGITYNPMIHEFSPPQYSPQLYHHHHHSYPRHH